MPAKTKGRPARRATSYRPRTTSSRGKKPKRGNRRAPAASRKRLVWLGFGLLVALAVSIPLTAPLIVGAFEGVLTLFGVLPLVVLGVAATDVWLLYSRRFDLTRTFARLVAGAHLAVLFAFGLAAFFTPSWNVGDVSFEEVTAGGNLGEVMAGNPIGIVAWVGVGLTAGGLIWPKGAWYVWQGTCMAGRFVRRLEIPKNLWQALRSFFTGLVPQDDEEELEPERVPKALPSNGNGNVPGNLETPIEANGDLGTAPTVAIESDVPDSTIIVTSEPGEKEKLRRKKAASRGGWQLPPIELLATAADVEIRPVDNEIRARLIVETLASFGVDAKVVSINQGPTVTQFGVEPGWEVKTKKVQIRDEDGKPAYDEDGKPVTHEEIVSKTRVRVNKVTNLANDLALALAAPTIRIEAPVPGKPIIGIEVPNTTTSLVSLRSVIESTAFQKANAHSKLAIALGKGVSGEPVSADLTKMPHLLIAGATGSGKSVCINSIIGSFLLHNTPEELRLVLVDPKRVELAGFQKIPHLAFSHVIVDSEDPTPRVLTRHRRL